MDKFPDQGAARWLRRYAYKNYWRVAEWIEYDDLVQEGFAAYYEVLYRYPDAVEPPHIMRLFQLVFRSKIENLVRVHTQHQVDEPRPDWDGIADFLGIVIPDTSDLRALLIKAPKRVGDVVKLFITEDVLSKPLKRYENGRRETMNERLCGLLGLDPSTNDVIRPTRAYFSGVCY